MNAYGCEWISIYVVATGIIWENYDNRRSVMT